MKYAKVGAIVVTAAVAAGLGVSFAGGAKAASQHSKAVRHHAKTTAHLENHPGTRDVGDAAPGTRDVGFTG